MKIYYQAPEIMMAHLYAKNNGILLSEKSFVRLKRSKPQKRESETKIEVNQQIDHLSDDPQLNLFSYSKPKEKPEDKKLKKKYLRPNPDLLPDSVAEIKILKIKLKAIHQVIIKLLKITKYYMGSRSRRSEGLSDFRNRFGFQGVPKMTPEIVESLITSKILEIRLYNDLRKMILNIFLIADPEDRLHVLRKAEIIVGKFPIKPQLKTSTI